MKQIIYFTFALVSVFGMASCTTADWPGEQAQDGMGSIEVQLKGSAKTRATTSTITKEEADLFLVTIAKGDEVIAQQKQLGNVGSMTFPAGYGYKLFVESITESDAETLNDGWGAKRFTGNSKGFGIQAGQTTKVAVNCTVANAAVAVTMAEGVEGCTVTISDGTRTLSTTEGGKTAYFNVPPDGSINVTLTVEKDGQVIGEPLDLSLEQAQVKDVNLQPSQPEPETGTLGITITYDDHFDIVPEEIIISEE